MYTVLGGLLVGLLFFAWIIVRYYSDPTTRHPLSTFITIISLVCSMLCVLLIPLDVYSVSTKQLDDVLIRHAYQGLFALLVIIAFLMLPFGYFYVDDVDDEDDIGFRTRKRGLCERISNACKSTSCFIIFVLILLFFTIAIRPAFEGAQEKNDVHKWVQVLLSQWHAGVLERTLMITLGVLSTLGLINFIFYTGYGIVSLPIHMIQGIQQLEDEQILVEYQRLDLEKKRDMLERETKSRGQPMSADERDKLAELNDMYKHAGKKLSKLSGLTQDWTYECWRLVYPIRVLLGTVLLLFSLLLIISLGVSAADMFFNSLCGLHCGFVMDTPIWFNPVDQALVYFSSYFPFDYAILVFLAVYLMLASIYGMVRLGIRIGGVQLFEIKAHKTWPQALLLLCVYVMLILLAVLLELVAIAPQYTTFGSQLYQDAGGHSVQCTQSQTGQRLIAASPSASQLISSSSSHASIVTVAVPKCMSSHLSIFLHRLFISYPAFTVIFYTAHWAFIGASLFSCFFQAFCRAKKSLSQSTMEVSRMTDPEDFDDDDF